MPSCLPDTYASFSIFHLTCPFFAFSCHVTITSLLKLFDCSEYVLNFCFHCYRGVFPWKSSSSSKSQDSSVSSSWRLFGSKSTCNLDKTLNTDVQKSLTPASSAANTPHHHRRQGSSASEKQFDDLVASSIALIQHDR